MKFPVSMLRDFVNTQLDAEALGDLLTMAGFELEGIEEVEGESVLDIKVVSNRGDGLSVMGLAREVLAKDPEAKPTELYHRAANRFAAVSVPSGPDKMRATVSIDSPDCTRYAALLVDGIQNGDSPESIQLRLRQAGMRPISFLVDLTNYVMLEQGQPLHAFDFEKLAGPGIVVRDAKPGEKLTTLNGDEHELQGQMMICDLEKPVGVPGVMGGLETEVSETTTRTLVESAHFRNTTVRRTRKQLGLSTEASYRFERSVDPEGVVAALKRFAALVKEYQPSARVDGLIDLYPATPKTPTIDLSVARAVKLLGMAVTVDQAGSYLTKLGFQVSSVGEGKLRVTAPTWRPDIQREEDLIEEIGRVHGYEKIPDDLPQGTTTLGGVYGALQFEERMVDALVELGFQQTISHTLRGLHPLDARSLEERVGPRNPNSPEMAHLRDSALPSLADAAVRNGAKDLHLFELGNVFSKGAGYQERKSLGILSTGALTPANRAKEAVPEADFFSVKAAIEALAEVLNVALEFETPATPDVRFHPGRTATVRVAGLDAGVLGQIHPEIAEQLDLPENTVLAELDVPTWIAEAKGGRKLTTVSRFPAVRRDIALLVDKSVPYAKVETALKESVGTLLEDLWVFDVYEGQNIPAGKHSLGIALTLRKADGTFTDEEANLVRERAVKALEPLGATTR